VIGELRKPGSAMWFAQRPRILTARGGESPQPNAQYGGDDKRDDA
jgi:hypothetical protein